MRQYSIPVLLVVILTLLSIHFYKSTDLYGYDEADYMYAAEKGAAANYLDVNALPLKTFIESGTNLGKDKSKRTELSEMIRKSDDISFYRHYHGPLYFYWLNILRLAGCANEASFRAGTLILLAFVAFILIWAAGRQYKLSAAYLILPVVLLFGCQMNILTNAMITPHAMYCVTSLAALILLSRFLISGKNIDWYTSLFALGLVFLSIEYAVLVAATFIFCLYIHRKKIFFQNPVFPFLVRSLGFLLLAITVLWLGGIIKLTLLKNYIFFTYFTLIRGSEFGSGNFFDAWSQRFIDSPVICTITIAVIIYFLITYKKHRSLMPLLVYPLLVLITSFRNTSPSPTYVSSIFPPIFLLSAIALSEIYRGKNIALGLMTTTVIGFFCFLFLRPPTLYSHENDFNKTDHMIVTYFHTIDPNDTTFVVPRLYLPTLHYYHPGKHFSAFAEEFDDTSTIETLITEHSPSGFLYVGSHPGRYEQVLQKYTIRTDTIQSESGKEQILYHRLQRF